MCGACSEYGGEDRRIQGFVVKHEGRRQLERPKRRWEDNTKKDFREVERGRGLDRSG